MHIRFIGVVQKGNAKLIPNTHMKLWFNTSQAFELTLAEHFKFFSFFFRSIGSYRVCVVYGYRYPMPKTKWKWITLNDETSYKALKNCVYTQFARQMWRSARELAHSQNEATLHFVLLMSCLSPYEHHSFRVINASITKSIMSFFFFIENI